MLYCANCRHSKEDHTPDWFCQTFEPLLCAKCKHPEHTGKECGVLVFHDRPGSPSGNLRCGIFRRSNKCTCGGIVEEVFQRLGLYPDPDPNLPLDQIIKLSNQIERLTMTVGYDFGMPAVAELAREIVTLAVNLKNGQQAKSANR